MAGLLLVVGLAVLVSAFLIIGNLARIADAIEKQNRHYGIGAPSVLDELAERKKAT